MAWIILSAVASLQVFTLLCPALPHQFRCPLVSRISNLLSLPPWLLDLTYVLAKGMLIIADYCCDSALCKSAAQPQLLAEAPEVPGTCTCQVYCPCGSAATPAGASDPSPPPCLPPAPSPQPGDVFLSHSLI